MRFAADRLRYLCSVKAHTNERIFENVDRKPDVWANSGHKWYLTKVAWTEPSQTRACSQLSTMREQIKRYDSYATFSCYVVVTKALYRGLTPDKLTELFDDACAQHCGILVMDNAGRCVELKRPDGEILKQNEWWLVDETKFSRVNDEGVPPLERRRSLLDKLDEGFRGFSK